MAARIRESGLVVYGFGERKTPKPFVSACDKFIYFDNIVREVDEPIVIPGLVSPQTPAAVSLPIHQRVPSTSSRVEGDARLRRQLRTAVEAASDDEGWANLANVGGLISKRHPDFDPRTFGYFKLSELIIATSMFDVSRRTPGGGKPQVMYVREKRFERSGKSAARSLLPNGDVFLDAPRSPRDREWTSSRTKTASHFRSSPPSRY